MLSAQQLLNSLPAVSTRDVVMQGVQAKHDPDHIEIDDQHLLQEIQKHKKKPSVPQSSE